MHPVGMHITQTTVLVPANAVTQLVATNQNRKYLALVNIGTGLANLAFGTQSGNPAVGQGWPLTSAAALGDQGGALTFEATCVTKQSVSAISAAGTTIVVLEGG